MTSLAISAFTEKSSNTDLRRRQQGIDAFAGLKPTSVLRAGDAIGEEELLQLKTQFGNPAPDHPLASDCL